MRKGYLSRRIYTAPDRWMRNAVLMVDEEQESCSLMELEGTEPPATTFLDGVILPFEPKLERGCSLENLLLRQFSKKISHPVHYWMLDYSGIFSGKPIPEDLSQCRVMRLC